MDEDDYFRRLMESAGVAPLDPAEEPPAAESSPTRPASDDPDQQLFEAAMRKLDTAPIDAKPGADQPRGGSRAPQRVRPNKKDLRVDERIDLHRCTAEQAVTLLEQSVPAAARSQSRSLLVITGKGYHSPGGVPVLRQRVEEWIRRHGRRHGVRSYSEAPRALGGRGAFVLYLQRRE